MTDVLRHLYFLLIVRPVILVVIGLNVRRSNLLPDQGPAVVVANHNSHLDTMVLMTLFGMRRLKDVHPVAAADHFLRNRLMAWFSTKIIGIIPLEREIKGVRRDPLAGICQALDEGKILILFPEGSRGAPEIREAFKTGIAHIAKRHPEVPFTPVFMHGLGRSLPKGEGILVPFFCDVFIGQAIGWTGKKDSFMQAIADAMSALEAEKEIPRWETS
ncbi:2-acyl-glycerophospho-ethanolamine acyltransferase [Stieleria maiorica]|uniref:2-acyl-glycerophospho-ethanolamine acyltransferase n=1 Tax=Stieleria maiorica TaxID=2795974 RepID=A0A5B9ML63_9BACT|nr:lysophospholipid acyltransferase family protein [Stieleria maiorica]QEG00425.1 2-acyl-glycerophospho-ethanolamine acyltransferase [Stieleria maiorica]